MNIASLNKYQDDLQNFLASINFNFSLIGICEHKITVEKFHHFPLPGYNFIFDSCTTTHGGTGFFISNHLTYKLRTDLQILNPGKIESTAVEILLKNNKNIICFCLYRHPSMSITEFNENYLPLLLE